MKIWPRLPSVLMVILTIAVSTVFLPSLSGCVVQDNPLGRWFSSLTGTFGLPEEVMIDLARFEDVYHEKSVDDGTRKDNFKQFIDAYKVVRTHYVIPVVDHDLINYAIEGLNNEDQGWANEEDGTPAGKASPSKVIEIALDRMMARLDPHSGYMTAREFQELKVGTSGQFGGLGIEVQQGEGFLKVVSPIEDTPADRAGLKPNDRITHVDGQSIEKWSLSKTVGYLRGEPGSPVTVTVDRDDVRPFDVEIVRDIIRVKAVKFALYDDYLHLRVTAFSERTERDAQNAFEVVHREIGDNLKGVILDLRNNPGGLLQQSIALSDMFLEGGDVVSIRERRADSDRHYGAGGGDWAKGLPVVVLVNGGSASASEIVSGALQDHDRAILMGRRTFGKGSVQTIVPLISEGAVKITNALYYLPSGRTIQQVGVAPDILLKLPEKKEEADAKAEMEGEIEDKKDLPLIRKEADLPNVLKAESLSGQNLHAKEGVLGQASVSACPEVGEKKDRELGCALQFLKSGSAQKFIASLGEEERG